MSQTDRTPEFTQQIEDYLTSNFATVLPSEPSPMYAHERALARVSRKRSVKLTKTENQVEFEKFLEELKS